MTGQGARDERPLTPCGNIVCTGCRVCGCPALGIAPQEARDDEREALAAVIAPLVYDGGAGTIDYRGVREVAEEIADAVIARKHLQPDPAREDEREELAAIVVYQTLMNATPYEEAEAILAAGYSRRQPTPERQRPSTRQQPIAAAFEARVQRPEGDGCWEWTGSKQRQGYGRLGRTEGGKYTELMAHRIAFELYVGPIPEGLVIDHLCRNRGCVNPDHLEPVTNEVNIERGEWSPIQAKRKYPEPEITEAGVDAALASWYKRTEGWNNTARRDMRAALEAALRVPVGEGEQ